MTDKSLCVFRFDFEVDMLKFFNGGPRTVNGIFPLLLCQWQHGMKLDASSLQTIPVWVKLPDLDLQFWTTHMLGRIASMVGKPCGRIS